jgi:hypothetical protein
MAFDLMGFCEKYQGVCIFVLVLVVLQCTGYLTKILNMCGLEGFELGDLSSDTVAASEPLGQNEAQQAVTGLGRTPSTCYPQQKLKPEDLLPTDENKAIQEFNISKPVGEGILQGVNMLDSTYHVGVNTIGQSLRNANRQLRSEPPNPQVNVSPWMNTTISPDLPRRPLEVGENCGTA